ncbi:MAG: hypothetical protein AB8E82_15415 [Aureispira sp.]
MLSRAVNVLKKYLETQEFVVELEYEQVGDFVEINWKKHGQHFYVYSVDVVYHKGRLAWFQSSEADIYRLCVLDEGKKWEWEPEMYNPFFGCRCLELCWIGAYLMFVYQEKHDIYIAAVLDGQVKYHNFHGDRFKLTGNKFAYQTYNQHNRALVSLLEIPSLRPLETIELGIAKRLGLEPESH